jgi:hypothetical protein
MEYLRHISIWWPSRVRVAGIPLRTATLGHLRVLEAIRSPFIHGGSADLWDAAAALVILSSSWRAARRLAARPQAFGLLVNPLSTLLHRSPGSAPAIAAVADHIPALLFVPAVYAPESQAPAPYAKAFGLCNRLAICAATLPLSSLSLRPHRLVWDYPIDEILLWIGAQQETSTTRDFQDAAEAEAAAAAKAKEARHG